MNIQETPTPASRLVERFGAKALADWSGRHISRVYAWTWSPARGGTGGFIPLAARRGIIAGARRDLKIGLAWTEFEPAPGEAYIVDEVAA